VPDHVLQAGQPAPKFRLPSSTGKTVALADFIGMRRVVLFFYPKADTPGCTTEACGFRDALPRFDTANAAVLGISPDPIDDVARFAQKFDLNYPLLADADHAVAEQYGVWQEKSLYGKRYFGVVRTTFVIGLDGRVERVFEKVNPEGHEREVMLTIGTRDS
jgi:peroxiredoxin Q/BCP